MTTAARPTWAPAKGGEEQGGVRMFSTSEKYSSRDLASHTKLKQRVDGQDSKNDLQKRDLREELEVRERRHFSSTNRDRAGGDTKRGGTAVGRIEAGAASGKRDDATAVRNIDADDSDGGRKGDSDDSEDDDDDDDDDTAELLAELERIKKERAEEKAKKDKIEAAEAAKQKEAELIRGNPLINSSSSFSVKRRWDEDVVFRNQARGESKTPKRFINDTIRSDFHRKFLSKYMK
eukprot:TRINITY_DN1814_c2_g1_i1.p2 TRINITY_DN1814_c2_g1~~TRINITY_DN1814_c2_g1_i1.p2  ORF type:complete len:234 (+),score=68.83 TRINITY_DN1814_c2_g1_i1:207-908(+)